MKFNSVLDELELIFQALFLALLSFLYKESLCYEQWETFKNKPSIVLMHVREKDNGKESRKSSNCTYRNRRVLLNAILINFILIFKATLDSCNKGCLNETYFSIKDLTFTLIGYELESIKNHSSFSLLHNFLYFASRTYVHFLWDNYLLTFYLFHIVIRWLLTCISIF